MDIFEFLRTAFRLVVAFLTPDILIYIGLGALLLMILWSVLSLVFSFENTFSRRCFFLIRYLKDNSLTSENYPEFTSLWDKFPNIMRRSWKRYEIKKEGLPSDYIVQSECLDGVLDGGITKQNRSLMKFAIYSVFALLALCSFAIIGIAQAEASAVMDINTKLFTEAMIIPLMFLLLFKINYYIYTSSRQHQYKAAVDTFHDFVDVLDEKIDISAVFFGGEQSIALISNIYENETIEFLRNKYQQKLKNQRNKKLSANQESVEGRGLNPATRDILSKSAVSAVSKTSNNVISEPDIKVMIEMASPAKTKTKVGNQSIGNQEEFVLAMEQVEKLIEKAKNAKDPKVQKSMNQEINRLVADMTAYKNKTKKSKERKI